ncbi:uncharacterized protein [Mytilus edulis]|uniref:uncharacterized protein n=1 Tax=Mytilus edulis TaxID=6550 RepID=UPI0039EF98F1
MCHISEESWNGDIIYRSGCKDNSKCASEQYLYPILGRRNYRTMKRVRCCNFNLCNERYQSQTLTIQPVKPDNTASVVTAEATTYTTKCYSTTPVLDKDSQPTDFILLFPDSKYYEHARPKVFFTSRDSEVLSAFEFGSHANQKFSLIRDKTESPRSERVYDRWTKASWFTVIWPVYCDCIWMYSKSSILSTSLQ